jgi:hypothetical protein
MNKKTIAAGAAAAALAGTIALGGSAVADSSCGPGATATVHYENVKNPVTGTTEREKITECPDMKVSNGSGVGVTTSSPAPGTGGLIFRDENGRDLGSGMGESDQFEWMGRKATAPNGTKLIYVKQTTRGVGGWGSLYEGWVRAQFTMAPQFFG